MAIEAFLINPPKRASKRTKRKLPGRRRHRPVLYEVGPKKWARSATSTSRKRGISINPKRKRRNPLPSGLLSSMIKKYGPKRGMKEAWKSIKTRRPTTKRRHRKNPIGEEVILVGANPRRKRRSVTRRRKHKVARRRRRTSIFATNPAPRRRRRRRMRRNPIAVNARRRRGKARRSFRRNPASDNSGMSLNRPMTILIPVAVGLAAKMATEKVPAMIGMTTGLPKYGVQAAVAIGGHIALKKFTNKTNANIWLIVSAVTIAADALKTYLPTVFSDDLSYIDMDAYPSVSYSPSQPALGGYDSMADSDLGAFPY